MKALRFWWWLTCAFVSKHIRVILATSLASISLALFIPKLLPYLPKPKPSRSYGLVGRYRTNDLPDVITNKISSGLTVIDENGFAQPGLATDWSINETGTEYTFTLDPKATWHDGSNLKAQDIQLPIENIKTEVIDNLTVKFTLPEPFSPFPTLLANPIFKSNLIGTGGYQLKSIKKNGEYVEMIKLTSDNDDTEIYRFYRTGQEVVLGLKLGEVDAILESTSTKDIPDWPQITVESNLNRHRYMVLLFNTKDNALAEKSFRQALAYSVPKPDNPSERAMSPISPSSWAYNPHVKPYNTDIDQAKELLSSTFADEAIPQLELTTLLPYLDRADEIAKAWSQIGVKTTVKVASFTPDNFQVMLVGQQNPPDPDQYMLWHSTQATNITGYSSPKVDKLLEDGRKNLDLEKRKEIYRDFQRFLVEDSPAAFLDYIATYDIYRR